MSETLSHEPTDPNIQTGAAALNAQLDDEVLREEREQLAATLTTLLEQEGPDGVYDYIGDILADTERQTPVAERLALFDVLAAEQKGELQKELIDSGGRFVEQAEQTTHRAQTDVRGAGSTVTNRLSRVTQTHEQLVGRHVHGVVNPRGALSGSEESATALRGDGHALDELSNTVGRWSQTEQAATQGYLREVERARAHQRALTEARNTLAPEYEGEAKNLNPLFSERVREGLIDRLAATHKETPDAQDRISAVSELLESNPTDETDVITIYATFANTLGQSARSAELRSRSDSQQVRELAHRYARQGNEYGAVRRPEDVAAIYQQQRTTLGSYTQGAFAVARQTSQAVDAVAAEITRVKQKIEARQGRREAQN